MATKLEKRYISRVSRRVPVGGKQKKEFLSVLRDSLGQYIQEYPDATAAQLEAQFGTPDDIAADFISQMSYREINDKFRAKTRVVVTVLVAAILAVSIWAIAVTFALNDAQKQSSGYGTPTDYVIYFGDGSYSTAVLETYPPAGDSRIVSGAKIYEYYDSEGVLQWTATLTGRFSYIPGESAVCTDSTFSIKPRSDIWSCDAKTSSPSGNKAVVNARVIQKFLFVTVKSVPVNLTITCDTNGNLT